MYFSDIDEAGVDDGNSNLVFDHTTGKFIVPVQMTPKDYASSTQGNALADIKRLRFDNNTGLFSVPVFMSALEYGQYVQNKALLKRC